MLFVGEGRVHARAGAYRKGVACLTATLGLCGCVSMKAAPVSQSALTAYRGQSLTVVTYRKSDFFAMTQSLAATGMFGAIGGAIGASIATTNGNKLVAEDTIPDPASLVSAKVEPQIRDLLNPSAEKALSEVDTKLTDEAAVSKAAGSSGVILDVQTVNWGFIYFPFSSHYRVTIAMRARLIDAKTGKRIAQAPCAFESAEEGAPTYDEMVGDQGSRLKAMLSAGTDTCLATIQKSLVN